MGLFNFNKEGPGVSKDAPRKKGIFLFFELLGRKFGKFLQVNMLYFLVSIPMILISALAASFFIRYAANILGSDLAVNPERQTPFLMYCQFVASLFVIFIGSGPASASLAYFNRCAVREEHTYLASDFFENFKKNFKQGIIVGIINPVIIFSMLFGILFYGVQYLSTGNILWFLAMLILFVVLAVFVSSGFYIYQLMITFQNSVIELYKNSIILALINIPQNIFFILLIFAINNIVFLTFTPIVTLIISFIGWIAIMRFIIEFYTARSIQKKLLNNINAKEGTEI